MKTPPKKLSVGFLFDDTLDSNDGVAQYVKTVGAWLSGQGHRVCYLVGETKLEKWSDGKVYSLAKNRQVTFNGNRLSMPMPANKDNIKKVLKAEALDVLHVMVPYSPFMAKRVIDLCPKGTVVVGTFHIYPAGLLSRIGGRLLKLTLWRSLMRFSQIVSVSSAAASFARQGFGLNTPIIPNTVNLSAYLGLPRKSEGQSVVFLGRLVKRKGCRQLILAAAELSKNLPEAKLIIAGDGPDRPALEKLVQELKLSDKVEFLGYIPENQKPELLASAAVACFPSLYGESFGIVLIEAMAVGSTVVLGGDNPGYRSVLGEQPVLLVDPNQTRLLANRLEELLVDKQLRRSLIDWQNKKIKQFDIDTIGPQLTDMYKRAIARHTKNGHNI